MAGNSETFYTFKADLKELDKLNLKLKEAKTHLASLGKATKAYTTQSKAISNMTAKMNQNTVAARKLGTATKTLNSKGSKMVSIFRSASVAIVAAFAFRAIIAGLKGVITTFADFEAQMAAVKAISGATDVEFGKLNNSAKELGKSTIFTATQVGELQEAYARLGFTADEILKAQDGTLALAAATGESLSSSAETAGAVLRAFGIEAGQAGRVADVMGASFTNSALTLERFSQSMKFVAPIARAAGFTFEETSAQLMILANNGLHGSLAGNALKNIFLRLGDANSKLNKKLGVTVRGLPQMIAALKDMKDETFGLTEATELLDKRSAPAFLTLLNNIENLEGGIDTLNNAEGAIASMAAIRLNTLQGDFTLLKSATEGLGIAIGDVFNIKLRNSVNGLTKWIRKIGGSRSAMNKLKTAFSLLSNAAFIFIGRLALLRTVTIASNFSLKSLGVGLKMVTVGFRTFGFSIKGATMALRGLRMAIGSTGIGLLVIALGSLVMWLTRAKDGMGGLELTASRLNDKLQEDIMSILLLTEGTSQYIAALRKLKQEHGEILKGIDAELFLHKDLIKLKTSFSETDELRQKVAYIKDIIKGQTEENIAKRKLLVIEREFAEALPKKAGWEKSYRLSQIELVQKQIDKIDDLKTEVTDAHRIVLKETEAELAAKISADETLSKFRVEKGETTRLKLRQDYLDDLEDFRNISSLEKQKISMENLEKELARQEMIQKKTNETREIEELSAAGWTEAAGIRSKALEEWKASLNEEDLSLYAKSKVASVEQAAKLNITIDEMRKKVENFSAALKESGDASEQSALSFHKLQTTKKQWKELIKVQIKNIKDIQKEEYAALQASFIFRKAKYKKELALMESNVSSIETIQGQSNKSTYKFDIKFLQQNKNKYDILKQQTVTQWELLNSHTKDGAEERLRIMDEMLKAENTKIAYNDAIQEEMKAEKETAEIALENKHAQENLDGVQAEMEAKWAVQDQDLVNFFRVNNQKAKNAKDLAEQETAIAVAKFKNGEVLEEAHKAKLAEITQKQSDTENAAEDAKLAKIQEVYGQISAIAMEAAQNIADFKISEINREFENDSTDRANKHEYDMEQAELRGEDTQAMQDVFNEKEEVHERIKEEKIYAIKKKMFNLKKINDIATAIINGAVAITMASAQTGVGAVVAAPIMAAITAAQIAMIASKKFVGEQGGIVPSGIDEFGMGGITYDEKFATGGMVHGARHSQGGVKFSVGGRVTELEGGEAVINRQSTRMFKTQLSAMNVAGGGVKFAQGGMTPGTKGVMEMSQDMWTAKDIASLISGSINSQQVYVSEVDISSSQSNVQVQESLSTLF